MIDCDPATQTWKPGGYALVIECAAAVLEQIRKLAVDGFNAFGHGGLEIGGVLYGSRDGEIVRIADVAPIACEHARGPGFVLSPADEEQLRAQLRDGAPEPELVPVGWFCSHTRSGIALSETNRDLYEGFFGEPWQIALVVKPTRWGPARAGLFYREKDGVLRCESSSVEFEIEPRKEASAERPAEAIEEGDTASVPPAAEAEVIAAPQPVAPPPARRRRGWWAGAAAAAALAAFSVYAWTLRPPEPAGLGLHTYELAGQVRIEWDRHAAEIGRAAGGLLEIDDGGARTSITLDPGQLRASSITYAQHSGDVLVRLIVNPKQAGAAPVVELTRFVGRPHPVEAAAPPVVSAPPAVAEPRPQAARDAVEDVEAVPRPTPAVRRFAGIPATPVETARPAALPAPPPSLDAAPAPLTPVLPLARVAIPQPPPAPAPAPAPAYTGPRSGRLVWTGVLGRRGVVEIDGGKASIGSLVGALPGVPVALRIDPAEFAPGGLVAYTADPAAGGRAERPAPANGWNATRFAVDAARVREFSILESPNPSNGYERLALRNDGSRDCPVLLIEWTVR